MLEWEERLSRAGYRLTAARRTVIRVMAAAEGPLSPADVQRQSRLTRSPLPLASVYRALDLLEELGLVRRLYGRDCRHTYVAASPGHRHSVLCRACGQAAEFRGSEDLEGLVQRVQSETGYQVEDHLLQLVGVCPSCQARAGGQAW